LRDRDQFISAAEAEDPWAAGPGREGTERRNQRKAWCVKVWCGGGGVVVGEM
jgi:hypothetical protein